MRHRRHDLGGSRRSPSGVRMASARSRRPAHQHRAMHGVFSSRTLPCQRSMSVPGGHRRKWAQRHAVGVGVALAIAAPVRISAGRGARYLQVRRWQERSSRNVPSRTASAGAVRCDDADIDRHRRVRDARHAHGMAQQFRIAAAVRFGISSATACRRWLPRIFRYAVLMASERALLMASSFGSNGYSFITAQLMLMNGFLEQLGGCGHGAPALPFRCRIHR